MLLSNILVTIWSVILLLCSYIVVTESGAGIIPAIILFWLCSVVAFYITQLLFLVASSLFVLILGTIFNVTILTPAITLIFFTLCNFVILDMFEYDPMSALQTPQERDKSLSSFPSPDPSNTTTSWLDPENWKKILKIGPQIWGFSD